MKKQKAYLFIGKTLSGYFYTVNAILVNPHTEKVFYVLFYTFDRQDAKKLVDKIITTNNHNFDYMVENNVYNSTIAEKCYYATIPKYIYDVQGTDNFFCRCNCNIREHLIAYDVISRGLFN